LMKKTHPQLWNYCIKKLKLGEVLKFMSIEYGEQQQLCLTKLNSEESVSIPPNSNEVRHLT